MNLHEQRDMLATQLENLSLKHHITTKELERVNAEIAAAEEAEKQKAEEAEKQKSGRRGGRKPTGPKAVK